MCVGGGAQVISAWPEDQLTPGNRSPASGSHPSPASSRHPTCEGHPESPQEQRASVAGLPADSAGCSVPSGSSERAAHLQEAGLRRASELSSSSGFFYFQSQVQSLEVTKLLSSWQAVTAGLYKSLPCRVSVLPFICTPPLPALPCPPSASVLTV